MEAKEFIIKKFELNNPELLKVINDWTEHSIKQNWDDLKIILNESNVPNCPKDNEYDDVLKVNKKSYFLNKTCENIGEYLLAKGFTRIDIFWSEDLFSPDHCWYHGHSVHASMKHFDVKK